MPAAIRYTRSRIDKLGVKPGHRVSLLGVDDRSFPDEVRRQGADASPRFRKHSHLVFLRIASLGDLARLKRARASIRQDGAVWVLWPKGRKLLTEDHVRAAALTLRLVDVKVVAFSPVLSALKLVIPVASRIE